MERIHFPPLLISTVVGRKTRHLSNNLEEPSTTFTDLLSTFGPDKTEPFHHASRMLRHRQAKDHPETHCKKGATLSHARTRARARALESPHARTHGTHGTHGTH